MSYLKMMFSGAFGAVIGVVILGIGWYGLNKADELTQCKKVVGQTVLVICKDGDCYDQNKFIADEATVVGAIKLYGHPEWMHHLNYDPASVVWEGEDE